MLHSHAPFIVLPVHWLFHFEKQMLGVFCWLFFFFRIKTWCVAGSIGSWRGASNGFCLLLCTLRISAAICLGVCGSFDDSFYPPVPCHRCPSMDHLWAAVPQRCFWSGLGCPRAIIFQGCPALVWSIHGSPRNCLAPLLPPATYSLQHTCVQPTATAPEKHIFNTRLEELTS